MHRLKGEWDSLTTFNQFVASFVHLFHSKNVQSIASTNCYKLSESLKEKVNTLPKGGVFLCYAKENTRQRKILERVEETFREQGYAVKSMSIGEVYKTTPN